MWNNIEEIVILPQENKSVLAKHFKEKIKIEELQYYFLTI